MSRSDYNARAAVVVLGGLAAVWLAYSTWKWTEASMSRETPQANAAVLSPPAAALAGADPIAFACPVRGPFDVRETYHSQFYEDYILSYVFSDVATGAYVDVGAHDPDIGNVTKYFYLKGWRGLNVEPNPVYQAALQKARPADVNVGVGIADVAATLKFYRFEERASALSTFDRETALRHQSGGYKFDELTIPVAPLTEVLEKSGRIKGRFEFLNIDVEGFERKVLTGLDFATYPPTVVMIESTAPATETPTHQRWESILYGHGYRFALDDGLNRYYVHPAERARLQRFIEVGYCVGRDKIAKRIKLDGFLSEAER